MCRTCYDRFKEMEGRVATTQPPAAILTAEYLEREYCENGKSLMELAREAGCSRTFVYRRLERFGLQIRTPQEGHDLAVAKGKLTQCRVNEAFFAKWSAASAWVLGLLWTDGSLVRPKVLSTGASHTPGFSFSQRDRELVEKLRTFVGRDLPIRYIPERRYEHTVAGARYELRVRNRKIYPQLLRLGLTPNKSLTIAFPSVPRQHLRHFVRGCWDGDGSVYVSGGRLGASFISGSEQFAYAMRDALCTLGLRPRRVYLDRSRKNPAFYIRVIDAECWKLHRLFYEGVNASVYSSRKRLVFETFFAEHPACKPRDIDVLF
jgi:hypothetical protein